MSDWKEFKLGEIAEINMGQSPESRYYNIKGEGLPFLQGNRTFGLRHPSFDTYCTDPKKIAKRGEILFSVRAPVGDINIATTEICIGRGLASLKSKFDNNVYLFYLLHYIKREIINNESGTVFGSVNKIDLENIKVLIPDINEQNEIAEILSSLDDKIDLLHRQNKTLEQIAETLFRQWFVEEAEEGWEVEKLGEVAVVQNGYAFRSKDYVTYQEGHLEVLKMGHIAVGGGLRTNPKKDFVPREEKLKKWTLNKNDIIMGMTDMKDNVVILGVPAIIDKSEKYVLNQRVARIYLKTNEKLLNCYLLYIQLNNKDFISTLQSKANSGVQVNLSTEEIRNCEILIPPMELQKDMGNTIADLFMKKDNNLMQIRTLTKLRDSLLPKLMSGEVRVFKK